ncbi:MAG: hypothetical protein IT210_17010 [Armatimonadetes bacterium]|nr:hypothetical protein [Armatimonadota bacterium]
MPTISFDLGGTLARYYERPEFLGILRQAICGAMDYLRRERMPFASEEAVCRR